MCPIGKAPTKRYSSSGCAHHCASSTVWYSTMSLSVGHIIFRKKTLPVQTLKRSTVPYDEWMARIFLFGELRRTIGLRETARSMVTLMTLYFGGTRFILPGLDK